ncbi:TPA: TrbC/VirB2 family protein [Enterococcus faecium]
MLQTVMNKVVFHPRVVAAVDIFQSVTTAGQDLKTKLFNISAILGVIAIMVAGLMFLFGRSGAQQGKSQLFHVGLGLAIILGGTSIVMGLYAIFGATAQNI